MDLYNPPPEKPTPQYSLTTAALPQSGMKPDTTVYRRTISARALSPEEQRDLYKDVQKGGDVPLAGLRMSAPQKPKGTAHEHAIAVFRNKIHKKQHIHKCKTNANFHSNSE